MFIDSRLVPVQYAAVPNTRLSGKKYWSAIVFGTVLACLILLGINYMYGVRSGADAKPGAQHATVGVPRHGTIASAMPVGYGEKL